MTVVDDLYEIESGNHARFSVELADGRSFEVYVVDTVAHETRSRYDGGHLDYSVEFPTFEQGDENLTSPFGLIYYKQKRSASDDGPLLSVWNHPGTNATNREEVKLGTIEFITPIDTE